MTIMGDGGGTHRADQNKAGRVTVHRTERRRAEAALGESEALMRSVLASLYGHVCVIDREGTIVAVNDAWHTFAHGPGGGPGACGISVNYLEQCLKPAACEDPNVAAALHGVCSILEGRAQIYTREYKSSSGQQERWFELHVLPLKRREGGAFLLYLDTTARHRAQIEAQRLHDELAHVTRVGIMGELTASLAHELNQPLTAILSNTQAALRMLGDGHEVSHDLREILQDVASDAQRAGGLIRKLRDLMRKTKLQLQPIDMNKLIVDVSVLLESDALIREVTIVRDLSPGLPLIQGDSIQLQQVLLNLMLNGLEAMRAHVPDSSRELIVSSCVHGDDVCIAVRDSGTGILAERTERIFDPFFTTKPDGMGMGLSISRSILSALGGRISGRNNAQRGATFAFTLPIIKDIIRKTDACQLFWSV